MAKGNDGNYLQHSLDVSAALHLAALTTERSVNVALTHGMAPYEPCGNVPNGQTRRLLDESLTASRIPPTNGEAAIVMHTGRPTLREPLTQIPANFWPR